MVSLVMALVCSVRAIPEETPSTRQSHNRGSFTNYVDTFLAFFDHLHTFIVDIVIRTKIICIIVDISSAPYLPRLVNIVCERPLVGIRHGLLKAKAAALIGSIPSLGFTEEMEKEITKR